MIPFNGDSMRGVLATREMNDSAASGAGLVAQQNMPNLFVDFVRNRIGVKNATFLTGLTGAPVTIPAQTSDTTVAWVSGGTTTTDANAAVSETTPVIGDVTLTPHKLGAYVDVGRDLILMGNPSATAIATESMFGNIARVLGTTMLKGNASNPTITGVATATGVQTQVIANMASATWANFTSMIGKIEGLEWNGPQEFVMSASDNALLKAIPKGNYGSGFIVEDGYLDGRRVYVDGSLSAGDIFLGDWSNIVVGQWGGIELLVDPFTQGISGTVRLIVHLVCDINVLRPNTFVMRVAE
jgi:HK97 family phage major capsid protein